MLDEIVRLNYLLMLILLIDQYDDVLYIEGEDVCCGNANGIGRLEFRLVIVIGVVMGDVDVDDDDSDNDDDPMKVLRLDCLSSVRMIRFGRYGFLP